MLGTNPNGDTSIPESKMAVLLDSLENVTGSAGGTVMASCPAHDDTQPSMSVSVSDSGKALLKCFGGCSFESINAALALNGATASGTGFAWPEGFEGGTVSGAALSAEVLDLNRMRLLRLINEAESLMTDDVREQVRSRFGITDQQIGEMRLGVTAMTGQDTILQSTKWSEHARLLVPFMSVDKGMPESAQGRALSDGAPKKLRWMSLTGPGWSKVGLFGHLSASEAALIVCEGPSDAMTAAGAGYEAVAVRGAAMSANSATLEAIAERAQGRRVIIAGDNDEAGRRFSARILSALRQHEVDVYTLNLGRGSDLNEWYQLSRDTFKTELAEAIANADTPECVQSPEGPVRAILDGLPGAADPAEFFSGSRLNVEQLIQAVLELGPIALGPGDNLYYYENGVWKVGGEHQVHMRVRQLLRDRRLESHTSNVISGMRASNQLIRTDSDEMRPTLNVRNGLLDWQSGELRPHSPEVPTTYQLTQGWNDQAECPSVDAWLREITQGDETLQAVLWELVGVSIMTSAPVHRAALLTGQGRNGKGTFLRLIEALVGSEHCSHVTLHELSKNRFAAADLFGSVVNVGGDLDSSHLSDTGLFKQATGGDMMKAERKYGQPFSFVNRAQMLFSANELPSVRDTSQGYWARWLVIPMKHSFIGHEDATIEAQLHAELDGVLVKAVKALRRLSDNGWQFTECEAIKAATESYRVESDSVALFASHMLKEGEHSDFQAHADLYFAYEFWCTTSGRKPVQEQTFSKRLKAAMPDLESAKVSQRRGLRYCILLSESTYGFSD